jgi:hypothetical protein
MTIIYSITSGKGDKVYIGSTKGLLCLRKAVHKYKAHCNSKILFDEYGFENCIFTVVEECEEEHRIERERYHIENTPNVVNVVIPGRTVKEYSKYNYSNNIEAMREKATAYREKNREMLKEKAKAYYAKKKSLQ